MGRNVLYSAWVAWALLAGPALAAELQFEFTFDPADISTTSIDGYEQVNLLNGDVPEDTPGTPWLPVKYVNVLIPAGAVVTSCQATARESLVRSGIDVYPVQPPSPIGAIPQPQVVPADPVAYGDTAKVPEALAVVCGSHEMRGYTFVSVRLNPVRYIPAQKELYLAEQLTLTVGYRESAQTQTKLLVASDASAGNLFDDLVSSVVVNPGQFAPAASEGGRALMDMPSATVDYLIITSPALSNSFQALANFRYSNNGLSTRVVTTNWIDQNFGGARPDGGSDIQTKIRNCISNYVASYGTTYVILGGDNTIVPDRDCYVTCSGYTENEMPSDIYYSGLNGTWDSNSNGIYGEATAEGDLAFDVIVARIPVRTTAQADGYIAKLVKYETTDRAAGFSKRTFIGGDMLWNTYTDSSRPSDTLSDGYSAFQSHSPVSDAEIWCRRLYRDGIQAYKSDRTVRYLCDTLTSWDSSTAGDYSQSSANLQTRLNEGWQHVSFNTHGNTTIWGLESGSYGTSSALALTNLTLFIYTMACLTGAFDVADPSLSEAFLRNTSGGALAYMGCSRYGWGSPGSYRGGPSMDFSYAFYNQVFNLGRTNIGRAFAEHKLAMIGSSTYNGSYRWIQFGLNLQGEPLVPLNRPDSILGNDTFWFRATALTNNVTLRWPDPNSCGYTSKLVHVRFRTDQYPANSSDGTLVYEGIAQTCEHTGLTPGQPCYYTIWVSQDGASFIEPAQ